MESALQQSVFAIRRERLAELLGSYRTRAEFVRDLTERVGKRPELLESVKAFMGESYVSRAVKGPSKKGGKNIGEQPALALEILFERPRGWMSSRDQGRESWPFGFSRAVWDELDPAEQQDAERQFFTYISGLKGVRRVSPRRRKTG